MANTYNGWKNYNTWNIALWIQNDEALYNEALNHVRQDGADYTKFAMKLRDHYGIMQTPDGVAYLGDDLDIEALNEMLAELA